MIGDVLMTSGMTPEVILSLLSSPLGGWSRVYLTLKVIKVIYEYRIKSDKEQEGGAERGGEREEGAVGRDGVQGRERRGGTEKGRGEGCRDGRGERGMQGGGGERRREKKTGRDSEEQIPPTAWSF